MAQQAPPPMIPYILHIAVVEENARLKEQLKNLNYLKYCNIARNEIRKFDKYAWAANPRFQYIQEDLDYFDDFDALQEEKRRLRLIHVFTHSTKKNVKDVLHRIPGSISIETFAENVARGYRLISEEIHKISYSVSFGGMYCPAITKDKRVNEALNIILENIEFNVGQIVPRPKKRKLDESGSTSNA